MARRAHPPPPSGAHHRVWNQKWILTQGGRCQLYMSVPLRQLTDKYKPDLHISKLICIAPETVCRKGMQLGWSWQDLCTGKKKEREQKANPSNTQASGSSGTSILWRTAVSGASAATREAQSCSPPSPCQSQQRRDAHSHKRWSVAGSLGGRLLLALELLHREPKLPSSLSNMSRAVRAAQPILCRLQSSTSALHGWHMWAWGSRRYSSPFIGYVPALNRRVVIPGPCASSAVTAINGPADQAAEMYLSLLLN